MAAVARADSMKIRRPRANVPAPRIAVTAQAPSAPAPAARPASSTDEPIPTTEPLGALLPALAPDGEGSGPGQDEAGRAAPSPRREAVTEPAPEAGHRLEHIEEGRQGPQLQALGPGGRSARERRASRAQAGLDERGPRGDCEERHRAQEGCPEDRERREAGEGQDEQRPLGHEGKRCPYLRRRLVDGLKRCDAPDPVIDSPGAAEEAREPFTVDPASPGHVAGRIVFLRPLPLEQRFRLAVTLLLLPVGPDRVAPVMPDHRAGAEPDAPALLLQAPAYIHVVAGGAELGIEPADGLQRGRAERHVAPGDVLGFAIRQEHVEGAARPVSDAIRDRPVTLGWYVRPAHAHMVSGQERGGQIRKPMRIGPRIVVDVGDDLSGRGLQARVAGARQTAVLCGDQPEAVLARDRRRAVIGSVVDDDHFEVRILEVEQTLEAE